MLTVPLTLYIFDVYFYLSVEPIYTHYRYILYILFYTILLGCILNFKVYKILRFFRQILNKKDY